MPCLSRTLHDVPIREPAGSPAKAPRAAKAQLAAALGAGLLAVGACTNRGQAADAPPLPPVCEAFVAQYERCITHAVPSQPDTAKDRAARTRSALEREVRRAAEVPSAAGPENVRISALTTQCKDNLQRLAATCGSSPTN